jgi:hypothetical protein
MNPSSLRQKYLRYRRRGELPAQALAKARDPGHVEYPHQFQLACYNPRFSAYGCKHLRWVESCSKGLRLVGYADKIIDLRHTGWYTDSFQDGTIRGIVYRLPHGRFVYGYEDPDNSDAALLCFDLDADDEREAARYADQLAEHVAEECRMLDEAYHAGGQWRDCGEQLRDLRKSLRELLSELRQNLNQPPAICTALKSHVKRQLQDLDSLRLERRKLVEGTPDWRGDGGWCSLDNQARESFNEGAGCTVFRSLQRS